MINWEKIRHEYITTNISQRKLAEKYRVAKSTLMLRAAKEGWTDEREKYRSKVRSRTEQKAFEIAVDTQSDINTLAMKIRVELMQRIYDLLINMPKVNGTKSYQQKTVSDSENGTQQTQAVEYSFRDLVASYRDLQKAVDEKATTTGTSDDPLIEILKRWDNAAGIASEPEAD